MTSKKQECFVYMTLPGQTDQITAGKYVLEKTEQGIDVGHFVYGRSYLSRADAVEIDPIELKLENKVFNTVTMKGVFGALRDASPDYWGRRIIERNLKVAQADEMTYLLQSADDRIGALGFGFNQTPPAPNRVFNQKIQLDRLQKEAELLVNEEVKPENPITAQVQELLLIGTSMGGARPKAVIEDDNKLWVAKFNRMDDKWNNALVEYAMLKLAEKCGIETALSKVVSVAGKDVLLVKRFDREKVSDGYLRYRMISSLTVLQAGDDYTQREKWSYIQLAEELRRISKQAKRDAEQLFRRMVFNALISNTDDHPRNHAFIAQDKNWQLSPAYDLTPNPLVSIEQRDLAMICGQMGRFANKDNLLSEADTKGCKIKERECRLLFSVEGFLRKRFGSVWTRMRPEAVCGQARFGDNSVGKLRGIL